jgi:hypothetical protein
MANLRLVPDNDQTEVERWLALANRVFAREIAPENARIALSRNCGRDGIASNAERTFDGENLASTERERPVVKYFGVKGIQCTEAD